MAPRVKPPFKSGLEQDIAKQLESAGIEYEYEGDTLSYLVPARDANYTPDFVFKRLPILIEGKGRFGHRGKGGAAERQKLVLVKQQCPAMDVRIVFQNAKLPIYKGSKTTYAKWADDHGFKWSDKGVVPAEWLKEIKQLQKGKK